MPTSTEEAVRRLGDLMIAFISETILGHERGLYKAGIPVSAPIIQVATANYLNTCYKSLIVKDDAFVLGKFREMTELIGHSEVCLINIIAQIMMAVHMNLDRSKIDTTSVETVDISVKTEVSRIFDPLRETVYKSLSHECHGEKIEDCDPNEPLFQIKTG